MQPERESQYGTCSPACMLQISLLYASSSPNILAKIQRQDNRPISAARAEIILANQCNRQQYHCVVLLSCVCAAL
jgi:hypothetical protein